MFSINVLTCLLSFNFIHHLVWPLCLAESWRVLYLVPVALIIIEGEALEEWSVFLVRSQWVFSDSSGGLYKCCRSCLGRLNHESMPISKDPLLQRKLPKK